MIGQEAAEIIGSVRIMHQLLQLPLGHELLKLMTVLFDSLGKVSTLIVWGVVVYVVEHLCCQDCVSYPYHTYCYLTF